MTPTRSLAPTDACLRCSHEQWALSVYMWTSILGVRAPIRLSVQGQSRLCITLTLAAVSSQYLCPACSSQLPVLFPCLNVLQGVLSLGRKGGQVSASLQVGSRAPVAAAALPAVTGPVRLGIQVLYGFNFSVTLSEIRIDYDSKLPAPRPPPSPPSPPPPPPPPPPPLCDTVPAPKLSYAGGYMPMGVGGGGAMSSFSMSPYTNLCGWSAPTWVSEMGCEGMLGGVSRGAEASSCQVGFALGACHKVGV